MAMPERVMEIAEEIVVSEGLELVFAEFVTEGGKWVLRLYIDREGGATITNCSRVSRQLAVELDVEDVISHAYILEVSSPGIDRIMGKLHDYERFVGEKIHIKLRRPVNGHRKLDGLLRGLDESGTKVMVESDDEMNEVPFDEIKRANLVRDIEQ